jgi:hypothetical protein
MDPYDRIYQNLPAHYHFLDQVPNCKHCNAKRFQYERPTFCCMGGKVKIVTTPVPDELRRLYTSQDPDAKYFRDNATSILISHLPLLVLSWINDSAIIDLEYIHSVHRVKFIIESSN